MRLQDFDENEPSASAIVSQETQFQRGYSIEQPCDDSNTSGIELQRNLEGLYEKRKAIIGELKVQVGLVNNLHLNEVSRLHTLKAQLEH